MKIITILFALFLIFAFLFVMAWLIVEWGKRDMAREKQYEAEYRAIKFMIENSEVNKLNFERIDLKLANLKYLPYKNLEKTDVLIREFYLKFDKVFIEKYIEK